MTAVQSLKNRSKRDTKKYDSSFFAKYLLIETVVLILGARIAGGKKPATERLSFSS